MVKMAGDELFCSKGILVLIPCLVFLFLLGLFEGFLYYCEYPMRLFSLRVYKANEKMGIRKDDDMTGKYIEIQRE
jgi:hypothetical protein